MIQNIAYHVICFLGAQKECIICCCEWNIYKYQLDQVIGVTISKRFILEQKLTGLLNF